MRLVKETPLSRIDEVELQMLYFSSYFRLFAVAGAMLFLSGQAHAQSQSLQHVADEAALAAVQTLARGGSRADAIVTAQQAAAAVPGLRPEVTASAEDQTVTVTLPQTHAVTLPVSSTARYLPPDQPAVFAWAARQRFSVKSDPVVVGSFCVRDCDRNPLR
jgi:Flp pilus assembly protein TadG